MALIELQQLTKIYPLGHKPVTAVDALDLSIDRGEFTVLAGPSGSGKTTVLNMIGALDLPTKGKVLFNGLDLSQESPKARSHFRLEHIGFIFQSYNLIPVLTAEENAEFTLMLRGVPVKERRRRVHSLFEELGLAGLEKRKPNDLSGGQQQRVAVARAMAAEPQIILADEPTANLDSHTAGDLLKLLRDLNERKGVTFVFSSHDLQVIAQARRVVELKDGRLDADRWQNG